MATVGLGSLGLVAASEMGVALERLELVAGPGRWGGSGKPGWPDVVAALVGGFDVVLMDTRQLRVGDARRLVARVRERSSVLVAVGADLPGQPSPLRLTITVAAWQGLGQGWGHLQRRRVTVEANGRGEAARPRRAELWLPSRTGALEPIEPVAEPVSLRPAGGHP